MLASLMTSRRFAPLFWCQFASAFNDNFLKNALVFLILFKVGGEAAGTLVTLAGGVFILPYFLLSGLGGQLADRFDKAVVARRLKLGEVGVAGVAVLGFALHSVPLLFVALGLFGVVGALFGPIKYGILPDHLARAELPAGNALVEAATFLAILLGTVAGGYAARDGGDPASFGLLLIALALACWGAACLIPRTGEAAPGLAVDRNILRSTFGLLRDLRADRRLWLGGSYVSWFWLVGSVAMSLLPTVATKLLGGSEEVVTGLLAVFAVAVALGSAFASWLASGRIVLLPTAVAALLMALFALDLGLATQGVAPAGAGVKLGVAAFLDAAPGLRVTLDFAGLAFAGGLFVVPAFAAVQAWAGVDRRARTVAGVNVLNAAYMVAGLAVTAGLQARGVGVGALFVVLGCAGLVAFLLILRTLPTNPFRDALSILFRAVHRLEVHGIENLEAAGPRRIIALNHVSFLDAALALSLLPEEPVFAIDHGIAQRWWVRPFLRLTRAMPLDPTKPLATRTLIAAVKAGDPLVIFPEGRLTVTGALMKVYDGSAMIADKADAVVVPVRIAGLETSPFSRLTSAQVRRRLFPKVVVTILEPVRLRVDPALKGKARRQAAGAALYSIMSDLVFRTTSLERTVPEAVIAAAREHGLGRVAVEDPIAGRLTYRRLLAGARVLGIKLSDGTREGEAVGVMLPSSNAAAATVLGLMSAGRVPAMINFTAGAANVRAACRAAEVRTIVTSAAFIEKGKLGPLVAALGDGLRIVELERVRAGIGALDRLRALFAGTRTLARRRPDDPAAILFTSGSEGTPKGVVLSHRNLLANAAQAAARIDFGRTDTLFNVLPVFHSFGLSIGLVLPLVSGVRVYLYPSPLHYRIVPELIYGSNATILFGTDTFLAGYARTAHPYDFRSLRYVLAGAEPVKDSTRRVWAEKFGLRILEGYGVTETAPALALNTPMFNRFGTVGRLLPGMEARLDPVPGIEAGGRLSLRGPNVMLGYLRAEDPGVLERPANGWHDTGDVVEIDADGFVAIRGRAKRFAKVAGEMVSLAAVEALAAEAFPGATSACATEPDPRKGERIVLFTTQPGATRAAFQTAAKARGATELMTPAEVVVVPALPLLGSGKLDYAGVAKLAAERMRSQEPAHADAPEAEAA